MSPAAARNDEVRESSEDGRRSVALVLAVVVLALMGVALVVELWLALSWGLRHDTPLLHYQAFLIERHGCAPYRDVFETSLMGSLLFHMAIGKVLGYGDAAFRLVDHGLAILALGLAWFVLRRFGRVVAWGGCFYWGLMYFGHGPTMSLQRDYVGILPVVVALLVAASGSPRWARTSVIVGALGGVAALFKPHLAIGLPVLLWHVAFDRVEGPGARPWRRYPLSCAWALLGFVGVLLPPFAWVWWSGGLPAFVEIFFRYLPLHIDLSGSHEMLTGDARGAYLIDGYLDGTAAFVVPVLAGCCVAWADRRLDARCRRLVGTVVLLTLAYSVYPVIAGQFWRYHWMPFKFFAVLGTAFVLRGVTPRLVGITAVLAFVGAVVWTVPVDRQLRRQLSGRPPTLPKRGRVDEIAGFLARAKLGPEDRVQPLDWTRGALHGMLRVGAVAATPYICDYHFYHHVSNPYIGELRGRFMTALTAAAPRFVIDFDDKALPTGADTATTFPALEAFLERNYHVVEWRNGFKIYARRQ